MNNGGRLRLILFKKTNDNSLYFLGSLSSGIPHAYALDGNPDSAHDLANNINNIYGHVIVAVNDENNVTAITFAGRTYTSGDIKSSADPNLYLNYGFIEGVARITTPVGDAACVVKNGTLYPILTEYDQATEDNWTLQDVYLNGDNEVSNLQQMVDRSGSFLAYTEDQEADKWSPIENYLHMHIKMPIVPKIGYVPAQQVGLGNVLPGLNYAVTL